MNADYQDFKYKDITEKIIEIFFKFKATDIEVGLLLNFGTKPEFKRKAFDNSRK